MTMGDAVVDRLTAPGRATQSAWHARPVARAPFAQPTVRHARAASMSRMDMLHLQRLAGNRAVVEALGPIQRLPWSPAPASTSSVPSTAPPPTTAPSPAPPAAAAAPAAPTWTTIDEAATGFVTAVAQGDKVAQEAAKAFIFPRLNGMNPEGLVAELGTVQRLDALYRVVATQTAVDIPRLSTAIAGVMSKKPADTLAALEMLDSLRSSGGSEAFWTENVAPLSATRLREILLVADHKVIVALQDALDQAPPKVHQKIGPIIARIFDPPASDIVLEFVPDQFDRPAIITLPDGTKKNGYAPIGNLTAKVRGRVAANVSAQGGMWQSQDAGGGHRADPTKPGLHKLGGRQKVRTSFWAPSQLAQETPLREVTKKGTLAVEYQGDDGRWHDTRSLATPITRDRILQLVTELRDQLSDPKALALVPDGVVPSTWIFNDFGDHAYRILGTDELVHTSPNQEIQHKAGIQESVGWSHGCLHLTPSGRDYLEKLNLLKAGVTLNVHAYVKGVKEYGTAPKFE
jgi:hypothetical protein